MAGTETPTPNDDDDLARRVEELEAVVEKVMKVINVQRLAWGGVDDILDNDHPWPR